jgi:hypothetical protein
MDFEFFLEKRSQKHQKYARQNYRHGNGRMHDSYHSGSGNFSPIDFINSIKRNKKLKIVFLFAAVVILAAVVGLVAIAFTLIKAIVDYISQNGISGLYEMLVDFLNTLWNGTK